MHAKDVLGKSGEQAAAEYLEARGLRILDRNWRCAVGEIDIVAVDRRTLVLDFTSQTTSTRRSAATMSISPSAQRQLRSRIRRPACSR